MKHTHFALPAIVLLALTLAACGSPAIAGVPPVPPTAALAVTVAPAAAVALASATSVSATITPGATATEQPTDMPVATDEPVTDDTVYLDPCTLLSEDTVEALYGQLTEPPATVYNSSYDAAPSRTCQYETEQVTLAVKTSSGGMTTQRAVSAELEQDGITLEADDETNQSFFGSTSSRAAMLTSMGNMVIMLDLTSKNGDLESPEVMLGSLRTILMMQVADEAPADVSTPEPDSNEQPSVDTAAKCELLTVAEVEQVLGKLEGAPDSESSTQNGVPVCSYFTKQVLMGIGTVPGDADTLQAQVERFTQQGAPLEVVPGLGDTAYVAVATMPNASNEETVIGMVLVLKNKSILSINLLGGTDVATTNAALLKLAQLAVERLP